MKNFGLAALALSASISAATAIEMQARSNTASRYLNPQSSYDWTGFYAGVNLGAARSSTNQIASFGSLAGVQLGYNVQRGSLVYGLEADFDASLGLKKTVPNFNGSAVTSTNAPWLVTGRLRVGLALGDTLAFVTGGLAIARVQDSIVGIASGYSSQSDKVNAAAFGIALGGGVEHAFNDKWTFKAEALYVGLSDQSAYGTIYSNNYSNGSFYTVTQRYRIDFTKSLIFARIGLNYRFGSGAPVLAR